MRMRNRHRERVRRIRAVFAATGQQHAHHLRHLVFFRAPRPHDAFFDEGGGVMRSPEPVLRKL